MQQVAHHKPHAEQHHICDGQFRSGHNPDQSAPALQRWNQAHGRHCHQIGKREQKEVIICYRLSEISVKGGMDGAGYAASGALQPRKTVDHTFRHPHSIGGVKPPDDINSDGRSNDRRI